MRRLRGSKVCVVALVRLIASYNSRQVILFINRIGERASPCEQVEQICHSITSALLPYGRLRDVKMVAAARSIWRRYARGFPTSLPLPRVTRCRAGEEAGDGWARPPPISCVLNLTAWSSGRGRSRRRCAKIT